MTTLDLGAENLGATVAEHEIVLLDFWASWCGPCRQFAPVYERASGAHRDIVFGKVDTEAEPDLAAAARISSIPTLMAFKRGVLVFSQPGALSAPGLEQLIVALRELDVDEALDARATTQGRSA
jgi:thioredoxin